tara:strand:- start:1940 stop:2887 length:948 start_codon:yes stop_codon:yes gene_type:complete
MPRSVYFSQAVRSEQQLYEDLIVESLKIYGQDIYYIPRTLINRDTILDEDPASKFDDAYLIEAYLENVDGFNNTIDLYSKFGLEIRDQAEFVISRRVWERRVAATDTSYSGNANPKPREGDLLFLPMTNTFFEIMFVEDDKPFYQLSDLPVYKLTTEIFEYSSEDFDTEIDLIDDIADENYQLAMDINLVTASNYLFDGERVQQVLDTSTDPDIIISGEIVQRIKSSTTTMRLFLDQIQVTGTTDYKEFTQGGSITGIASQSGATITTLLDTATDTTGTSWADDELAQNVDFETVADGFLDFSEVNPFGDPSETY